MHKYKMQFQSAFHLNGPRSCLLPVKLPVITIRCVSRHSKLPAFWGFLGIVRISHILLISATETPGGFLFCHPLQVLQAVISKHFLPALLLNPVTYLFIFM